MVTGLWSPLGLKHTALVTEQLGQKMNVIVWGIKVKNQNIIV